MKQDNEPQSDFDAMLEALVVRKPRKPLAKRSKEDWLRTAARKKATMEKMRKKRERVARIAARINRAALRVGWGDGAARTRAANAKNAAGGLGRWFKMLRAMKPGESYTRAEIGALIGLDVFTIGGTANRDLARRGFVAIGRKAVTWRTRGHAVERVVQSYTITALGERVAAGEESAEEIERRRRPRSGPKVLAGEA